MPYNPTIFVMALAMAGTAAPAWAAEDGAPAGKSEPGKTDAADKPENDTKDSTTTEETPRTEPYSFSEGRVKFGITEMELMALSVSDCGDPIMPRRRVFSIEGRAGTNLAIGRGLPGNIVPMFSGGATVSFILPRIYYRTSQYLSYSQYHNIRCPTIKKYDFEDSPQSFEVTRSSIRLGIGVDGSGYSYIINNSGGGQESLSLTSILTRVDVEYQFEVNSEWDWRRGEITNVAGYFQPVIGAGAGVVWGRLDFREKAAVPGADPVTAELSKAGFTAEVWAGFRFRLPWPEHVTIGTPFLKARYDWARISYPGYLNSADHGGLQIYTGWQYAL